MNPIYTFFRCLLFCLIFCCHGVCSANGQTMSLNERLTKLIINQDIDAVVHYIDSAGTNLKQPIYLNLTPVHIALFSNSNGMVKELVNRAGNLDHDYFSLAALVGNPDNILAVLNAMNSTDIEDYMTYDLLEPIAENSRLSIVGAISDNVSEDSLRAVLEELEYDEPQQKSIDIWLNKLGITFSPDTVKCMVAEFALEALLESNINNTPTQNLVHKFTLDNNLQCLGNRGKEFTTRALENNLLTLAEVLISNGFTPLLAKINIDKVEDKDFLLGFMVQNQIIDLDPTGNALSINRSWKLPEIKISIPGVNDKDKPFTKIAKSNSGISSIYGETSVVIQGTSVPFIFNAFGSNASVSRLLFDLNLKRYEYFSGWTKQFKIFVPQSDTLSWGTYHTIRINNLGTSTEGIDLGSNMLFVYREGILIDTVYKSETRDYSRALGSLEIYGTMAPSTSFGTHITVAHEKHKKMSSCDIRTRLHVYQRIIRAMEAEKDLKRGQNIVHDAAVARRLCSEQLLEANAHSVINGELRIAMKSLAEQSEFNSSFTSYVYRIILDASIPEVLESFLSSSDPEVRTQAEKLANALDKKDEALKLLEYENINSYIAKVKQVKGLIYELAQYCTRESLEKYLNDNLLSLNSALRKSFKINTTNSLNIFSVNKEDLDGKGDTVLKFLSL